MEFGVFYLISGCFVLVESRGPHHPRGDRIVRRHVHYKPTKEAAEKLTEDVQLLHDKEHIQEHLMEEVIDEPDLSKMSDEELEFYYFQVHDSDKNSKLDGLEILQAISHTGEHDGEGDHDEEDENHVSNSTDKADFEYYVELIDQVLAEDDADGDGYLSYAEYAARRRNKLKRKNDLRSPSVKMVP